MKWLAIFIFIVMVFPPFTFSSQNYDFLIICPDKWKDLLEQFKEYKEEHGIKTIIAGLGKKIHQKSSNILLRKR